MLSTRPLPVVLITPLPWARRPSWRPTYPHPSRLHYRGHQAKLHYTLLLYYILPTCSTPSSQPSLSLSSIFIRLPVRVVVTATAKRTTRGTCYIHIKHYISTPPERQSSCTSPPWSHAQPKAIIYLRQLWILYTFE